MSNDFNWNGTTIHEGQEFSGMAKNVANDNDGVVIDKKISVSDEFKKEAAAFGQKVNQDGKNFFKKIAEATAKYHPEQHQKQENSVSPVNSVSPAKPEKSTAETYMDMIGVPRLTPEQEKRLAEIQKLTRGIRAEQDHEQQPEHVEKVQVQSVQDIQNSINKKQSNRYRDNLDTQYSGFKKMAQEYGKLGKTFNAACEKYGYSDNLSAEKKQALLDAHPELARAKDKLESFGNLYKEQVYRVGRAAQKCNENGVNIDDFQKQIKDDIEKGEFDVKGPSALEKISQAIAQRISKLLSYVKRSLGFGKKDVQAEQTQAKPTSSGPTLE